jgi:dienelactone hydrolase
VRTAGGRSVARVLALAPALALCAPAPAGADPGAYARPGPFPVGVRTLVLTDSSRDDPAAGGKRVLVTEVWYPAVDESRALPRGGFLDFFVPHQEAAAQFVTHFKGRIDETCARFRTLAARDAPPREGKFPLLVFSHGNGGLRHQNVFQLDHLASHGYVVASPDHTGNAGVAVLPDKVVPYDRKGRQRSAVDRPRDAVFVVDRLLAENETAGSWLHGRLDARAIGSLGHSFGGYTCVQHASLDPRVKAVLPMTLAYGKPSAVPILLMLGGMDRTVDEAGNALNRGYFTSCPGPKHLLVLKRGGHFSFSDMDIINPAFGDGIGTAKDGTRFLDMGRTKEVINAYSLAFFDGYLRGDRRALEFLGANAYPEDLELRAAGPGSTGEAGKEAAGEGSTKEKGKEP